MNVVKNEVWSREISFVQNLVMEDNFCNAMYFLSQVQFTVQVELNL